MSQFLGLIPVGLGWLGCYCLCRELAARQLRPLDWRLTMALASCGWGALVTVIVEGLSLVRGLTSAGLSLAWSAAALALVIAAFDLARRRRAISCKLFWESIKHGRERLNQLPLFAKVCWTAITFIGAFLFAVAVTTPTTNWDSLTYHLPRVMHWIQEQSVEHFPTENSRQLEFGPWAGFVSVHLFLLEGTDRLVNLPQWLAMAQTTLLLSLLVDLLGRSAGLGCCSANGPERWRARQNLGALAALLGATIPMGMMQSLTPQVDYLTTFWVVSLYAFTLAYFLEPDQPQYLAGMALSLSLAMLTKSTALIYTAPLMLLWGGWMLTRRSGPAWKVQSALAVAGAFLVLCGPHAKRNYALFGSPLGSAEVQRMVRNGRLSPGVFASNLIRNLALQGNCGVPVITRAVNRVALALHALTGERLDDPATTYPPGPVRFHERFILYDDYASAPVHLVAIALALSLAVRRGRRHPVFLVYAGSILASVCLFAALLKYQAWHSRFHMAYLVLFSPLAAIAFLEWLPRRSRAFLPVALCFYALFCLYANEARPIFNPRFVTLSRERQYLDIHGSAWNPALERIAEDIAASGCRNVGLKLGFDAFEYPIWTMLRNRGFQGRIDHYYVEHVSASLASDRPPPCAIIAVRSEPPEVVTRSYPYRTECPPLMVLWADEPRPRAFESAQSSVNREQ